MMLGLAAATSGSIRVLGLDMPRRLDEVLPRVGALVEGPAFYPFLSGAANLHRFDAADPHAPAGHAARPGRGSPGAGGADARRRTRRSGPIRWA